MGYEDFNEDKFIKMIGSAIENYDKDLSNHCKRTADLSLKVAESLSLKDSDDIYKASLVHDIGKIFIDPNILLKAGSLSPEERKSVDKHSVIGYIYLKSLGFKDSICEMVLFHHGYCKDIYDISGKNVNKFYADIIRACDIFDAVTHKRTYHDEMPVSEALKIIKGQKERISSDIINILVRLQEKDKWCEENKLSTDVIV